MASRYLIHQFQPSWFAKPYIPALAAFVTRAHTQPSSRTILPLRLSHPPLGTIRFSHQIPGPPQSPADTTTNSETSSSSSTTTPATTSSTESKRPPLQKAYVPPRREPSYELTFTCVPCGERSTHSITKQGYHYGSVLIACPNCRNRHVISDHLNIFGNRKITVEDLLREKGQLVKKGTLGEDGDLEFWADGSVTSRAERNELPPEPKPRGDIAEQTVPGSTFKTAKVQKDDK